MLGNLSGSFTDDGRTVVDEETVQCGDHFATVFFGGLDNTSHRANSFDRERPH